MDGTEDPARWRETGEKFELFDTSSLLYSLGRGVLEKKNEPDHSENQHQKKKFRVARPNCWQGGVDWRVNFWLHLL